MLLLDLTKMSRQMKPVLLRLARLAACASIVNDPRAYHPVFQHFG